MLEVVPLITTDGPKDNDTEGQDEEEYWNEAEDLEGDAKPKVLRSGMNMSLGVTTRTSPQLLLHLLIPLMVGMVNGRMKLKDGQLKVRLGPPVSTQNICQHEYIYSPNSHTAKQQTITNRILCLSMPITLITLHPMSVTNLMM